MQVQSTFFQGNIPLNHQIAQSEIFETEQQIKAKSAFIATIRLAETLESEETVRHANRVAAYSKKIYEVWAKKQGFSHRQIEAHKEFLHMAARLHDIGKITIPGVILNKAGRLSPNEYEVVKQHTVKGAQMFLDGETEFEKLVAQIALNHHERWDGNGYPGHIDLLNGGVISGHENEEGKAQGKYGQEIPLFARIVAVTDVYDALSSPRVYKDAWKETEVLKELAGKQFDPDMIDAFFSNLNAIRTTAQRFTTQMSKQVFAWNKPVIDLNNALVNQDGRGEWNQEHNTTEHN